MNADEATSFLAPFGNGTTWNDKCIQALKKADPAKVAQILIARDRARPKFIDGHWNAWGIPIAACAEYCSRAKIPMQFDFSLFSSGVTNYLLPWLGLTAQLPYETGSSWNNFMAFCLAIGSPMLITFSLSSTALNTHWTSKRFAPILSTPGPFDHFRKGTKEMRNFLRAAQQSPIRINEREFMSLLNSGEVAFMNWTLTLQRRLNKTRRRITFSLVAQALFAIAAWGFTIGASYSKSLGIPSQALLLSSGTLWVWLVPVVGGWVFVGTQSQEDTILDALNEKADYPSIPAMQARSGLAIPTRKIPDALWNNVQGDERLQGPAFNYARILTYKKLVEVVATSLEAKLESLGSEINSTEPQLQNGTLDNHEWAQSLARDIDEIHSGDERSRGSHELTPVNSRSRSRSRPVHRQYESHHEPSPNDSQHLSTSPGIPTVSISQPTIIHPHVSAPGASNQGQPNPSHEPTNTRPRSRSGHTRDTSNTPLLPTHRELSPLHTTLSPGSAQQRSASTRSVSPSPNAHRDIYAYIEWEDLDSDWKKSFVVSNILAVFLQWGVVGSSIIISYLTEVRGLGCRSGSYLLYGILSTLAHVLLLSSVFLSHQAMLIYQRSNAPHVAVIERRIPSHERICRLAVITRVLGKTFAFLNATWIILSSLWELIGFYDSCWCQGTVLMLGKKAWIVLFIGAIELREQAEPSWAGGITMSIFVGLVVFWVVWRYSHEPNR